jgi:hypothetical protein
MLVIVRRLYIEAGMDSARSDGGGGGGGGGGWGGGGGGGGCPSSLGYGLDCDR